MVQTLSKSKYFTNETKEISLCFQCLSAYNQGYHHFLWCDISSMFEDSSDFEEFENKWNDCLKFIISTSPVCDSEEIFFTDYEGFISSIYSEYLSAKEVFDFLELIKTIQEDKPSLNGYLINAINDQFGGIQDLDFYLDLVYFGEYDSGSDFAECYHDDLGTLSSVPDDFKGHIDFDSVWRDMEMGEFFEIDSHYFLK